MTVPAELGGEQWGRAFEQTPFQRAQVVQVLRITPPWEEEPWNVVCRLVDRRWLHVSYDPWAQRAIYTVDERLDAVWWQIDGVERLALGPAPPEARSAIGCARCEHAAPHPCDEVTDEGELCDCEAPDPIPGPLATHGWRHAFAPLDDAPVVSLDGTPDAPFTRHDVAEVVYHDDGEERGRPWTALLALRDGRWAHVYHWVDARDRLTRLHAVARDLETLWWQALGDADRERFAPRLGPEHRPMMLVALDRMLGSSDPAVVAKAEAQIARLRAAWGDPP